MAQTYALHQLRHQLEQMGIGPGSRLVVHSSLRAVGKLEQGAATLLRALLETVTSTGLLMMPTFSYCYAGRPGAVPFDAAPTKSETGYLTEAFRQLPGVVRSNHPTHSVAVWGKDAHEIAQQDPALPAFDAGTPLHRLAQLEGEILLIGVGHESNSSIHVAEFVARLPFLNLPNRVEYGNCGLLQGEGGSVVRLPYERLCGCSLNFPALEQLEGFDQVGQKHYPLGDAECRLLPAKALLDFLVPRLQAQPGLLLCAAGFCPRCDKRRAMLEEASS
ncbi:AAC(3) family N-acetyltransferase [Eubacteriales bacterium OttesenSCG-928-K08]|nr:AAC(3) family N-acetyltransferase [Eubacteriales bacterium OttesenSCG-928-K08]